MEAPLQKSLRLMNPRRSQYGAQFGEPIKKQPPGVEGCLNCLSSLVFFNKNPGKIIAGKKFNTGAVSESPPHRAWVKTVIVRQAVLLALDLRSPKPSQNFRSSGI